MNAESLNERDFASAAAHLGCDVAAIKAVAEIESNRGAFFPDGSPTTLFEGHVFSRLTQRRYDLSNPDLSFPRWSRQWYGKSWREEKDRLERAARLSYKAAMMSASWGMFQIMGFNHAVAGFVDIFGFVAAMHISAGRQLDAFVSFIEHAGLADELRDRRWADFARRYNGPGYAANRYDVKLAAAYHKHAA